MTSRLKRKLDDLGVDTSGRRANENFCLIGTPLPPLEKSKDTGEFVPLWKQDVRDEKGRRRLHGAFTGGFSAGYFNTVGSKEGWTPATFTSSRNDRAKKKSLRPEDFMDEEDLQDLKDSRTIVDTTEQMDFLGGTQAELRGQATEDDSEKDPITRALEASLLPTPKDSVGAKILKRMGWRLGQGIGTRISLRERKIQDKLAYDATTGTRFSGNTLDIPDDDEEASKHSYARRDTPVLVVKRKDNSHGLGYIPGMSLNESLGSNTTAGAKGPRLAGGFGLGALNDADEDDLDVYDHDQRNSRQRVAYDHINGDDDDTVVIGRGRSKAEPLRSSTTAQYFRDGRPVLAGFVLSDDPVAEDRWFSLPDVPPDWKPDPRRIWEKNKENAPIPVHTPPVQTHAQWKRSAISADQRGTLLGETPLQAAPRSVFDYMSEKDRERIKRISSNLKNPEAGIASSAPGPPSPPPSLAKVEPHIAQAALRGFQPFTTDPAKQARYTVYLHSQATQDGSAPSLAPLPHQGRDEFQKELEDYAKAASLFKPMSGAMAGRFTSAAVIDHGPKIIEGLHTPSAAEIEAKEAQERKDAEDKISPKVHAAKMGMFGPLTREKRVWRPAKLLCKRFNVKEPEPEAEEPPVAGPSGSKPSFAHPEQDVQSAATTKDFTTPVQKIDGPRDLANVGLGDDETQGRDTLTYERPSMDIFKAIFASDSEDSDDDEPPEDDKPTTTETVKTGFTSATDILKDEPIDINTFRPTFVPREGKAKKDGKDEKTKDKKEKKEKKEKRKKEKKSVLVSFEMDDDGNEAELKQPKDRPAKKRRDAETGDKGADDDVMWAAKESVSVAPKAPEPALPLSISPPNETNSDTTAKKGRKRAIDFM